MRQKNNITKYMNKAVKRLIRYPKLTQVYKKNKGSDFLTRLLFPAYRENQDKILKLLVSEGADINNRDFVGSIFNVRGERSIQEILDLLEPMGLKIKDMDISISSQIMKYMANSDIEVLMNKDIPLKLATAFDIAKRSETRNIRRMFKNVHSNEIIAEISHIANSIYSSLRPMEYTFGFQYDGTSSGSMWITYQTQVTNSSAGNMIYNSSSTTPYILTGSSWVQINVPPQSTYQSGSNGWTTTSGLTTYTIGQAGNTGYSGAAGQAGISGFSGASGYSGFNVFSCDIKDTELMKEIFCHMVDRWKKATNEVCA